MFLFVASSCAPSGKQQITTPEGDKVWVEDWIVSLKACVESRRDFASLAVEQQRKFKAVLSILRLRGEISTDFSRKYEATYHQQPPESMQQEVSFCANRLDGDKAHAAKERATALLVAGGVSTALSIFGAGLAIGGGVTVKKAEDDFHAGPSASDRNYANKLGERGEKLAAIGVVSAVTFAAIGIPLLVVGKKQQKQLQLSPQISSAGLGVFLSGRF